ncbi:hypothetical protein BVRB_4g095140 [Beta vulgaris subsp. vulgaris]|uniref:Uncharacterized protein n=1 Tax=Beta vulgaris subsp. vulgaris TaxID=3555 RepID=A0A0J8BDZ7_BETVV|nr:hypothetical protein BVRB_4g095140 [Beta vulgaris subsp. vulgaris]
MRVHCRPHSLELLIKDLTAKQIDAVKEAGFGGILGLKLTETCRIMMPWLLERFDGGSLMFNIGANKDFVATRYDVFCLPMNVGNDVPEIAIVRVGENIDSQLKEVWKQQFNVHGYDDMNESRNDTLSKLDDFNKKRDVLAAEVRSRKKAIVAAKKERINQEKEKAQKMVVWRREVGQK